MNKKILYVGGFELPDKNAAAHRVLGNAKAFRDLGNDVAFISIDSEMPWARNSFRQGKVQGFCTWFVPYPIRQIHWLFYLTNANTIIRIIESYYKPNILICYNLQSVVLAKMLLYCRKHKIIILGDCTEWYKADSSNLLFYLIKSSDTFLRMRILHKKLDGMIVISKYLEKYYSKSRNILRLPPLIDSKEDKWRITNKVDKRPDILHIVYAGSPGNKDNFTILLKMIAKYHCNIHFSIIGITENEYIKEHDDMIMIINNIKNKIKFLGKYDHLSTIKIIKDADCTFFFRENNRVTKAGFPTKFVESISCHVPVLTNKNSDLEEYIYNNVNGIFVRDENELYESYEKIKEIQVNNMEFEYTRYLSRIKSFLSTYI